MKKIFSIVGARPNFIKIAPVIKELDKVRFFHNTLIHTGQHYDAEMSDLFFRELGIRQPDKYLGIGSGSHAQQTGRIMMELEKNFLKAKPDLVLVVGDVNSTLAASIAASKLCIPVAHVEAGLRSFDRTMPEEINRIVTDRLSDFLFTTSRDADQNLLNEGIARNKIHFVGNVMIDTLELLKKEASQHDDVPKKFGLKKRGYGYITLHRPSNVDDRKKLAGILRTISEMSKELPFIFPAHPRTTKRIDEFGLRKILKNSRLKIIQPLGYLESLNLIMNAKLVITDSGGIQEETTVLKIPCLTVRENTERPITVTKGTNTVVGTDPGKILAAFGKVMRGKYKRGMRPPLWDGKAARRIARVLADALV
jgi:UDP-N-acetylglucosamine 2-epimerase (non-hydrolysing)